MTVEFGISVTPEVDSWRWVRRAEELGFTSAWFNDSQLINADLFVSMALAAANTDRIRLGTGVLVPSNRIEPVTANALASLNRIAPGRIDFGVGTGFTARRTMGLGALRLDDVRCYVERVQGLLRGEIVELELEGRHRKAQFLNPDVGVINLDDEIPLWMSALGPRSRQLAAELGAGWLSASAMAGAVEALEDMRSHWRAAGRDASSLRASLMFLGAVLTGDKDVDDAALMAQAAPSTAMLLHNLSDDVGPMGGRVAQGPLQALHEAYLEVYDTFEPADAKYIRNHRGHLMFVRPEDAAILSPDLVRRMTMSGTPEELVPRLRGLVDAGYDQIVVQLVHGHEQAIESWAEVFQAIGDPRAMGTR